jgi:RNA polymerase sigma-70 factor (ECF subfamily)
MNRQPPSTGELIARHGAWLRRLAGALVRQEALAEDLVQDAWEATLRRPPERAGSERGWLARVVGNRLRNHARSASRRRAREEVAGVPEPVATPEEAAARVELQRRIGNLVASLPESQQQVIYLRFFEDLAPVEIARRLGVPGGTVRWRLKVALDELRLRLDREHGGERRRWIALLAPLGRRGAKRGAARALILDGAMMGVLALVACSSGLFGTRAISATDLEELPRRVLPPAFAPPAIAPSALPPGECPEVEPLRREIALRTNELAPWIPHSEEFARSEPNPVAQRRFEQVLERVLKARGHCPYAFECRGSICIVQVLVPEGERLWTFCPAKTAELTSNLVPADHLSHGSPSSIGNETPVRDPLSGQSFRRHDLRFRLARPDAEPVPWAQRPALAPLAPGRHARWASASAGASGACRAEIARLEARLATLYARGDELALPHEAFASSVANPDLIPEVRREIARITGLPETTAFPLALECRGTICALSVRDARDPSLLISWRCETRAGRERCKVDTRGNAWFARLLSDGHRSDLFARIDPPSALTPQRALGPFFLRLRPPAERDRADAAAVLCALDEQAPLLFERCEREPPAAGALTLQLRVPGPNDHASRIAISDAGPLAGTPLGRCVLGGLRAAADLLEVPPTHNGLVTTATLHFPGARSVWPSRRGCRR